jgi:hypothetical protein
MPFMEILFDMFHWLSDVKVGTVAMNNEGESGRAI